MPTIAAIDARGRSQELCSDFQSPPASMSFAARRSGLVSIASWLHGCPASEPADAAQVDSTWGMPTPLTGKPRGILGAVEKAPRNCERVEFGLLLNVERTAQASNLR